MSIRGKVEDDNIKLPEGVHLPNGTEVNIEPVPEQPSETFADGFREFFGIATDLPADLAENHDHYLYGVPKQAK